MKKNSIYEPIMVRDGFHNYMCIAIEYECPEYEIYMINEHKDSCGMLSLWQGEEMLKYEVEGYTSFDKVLSETEHQYELIREALIQIVDILNNLDNYLLHEDRVILQFNMVYWSNDSRQVKLCYLPGGEGNIQEQFESLIEAIMRNMNHRDNELIKLVYGIYHIIREDNYSLKHIENILNEEAQKGQEYNDKEYEEGRADELDGSGLLMENGSLDLLQEEEKQEMKHKKSDEKIQEALYGETDTIERIIIFREVSKWKQKIIGVGTVSALAAVVLFNGIMQGLSGTGGVNRSFIMAAGACFICGLLANIYNIIQLNKQKRKLK